MPDPWNKKRVFVAPIRLSLIGGGTDVEPFSSEEGTKILNFACSREVRFEIMQSKSSHDSRKSVTVEIYNNSGVNEGPSTFLSNLESALNGLAGERKGHSVLRVFSPVPNGSGLGTSSTIVLGSIFAVKTIFGIPFNYPNLIDTAAAVERFEMKILGGFQDYFPAAYGGFNLIQKSAGEAQIKREMFRVSHTFQRELETRIFCFDLQINRRGEAIIQDQVQRSRDLNGATRIALRHQLDLAERLTYAISGDNFEEMLDIIDESFLVKKKFSPLISTPEIDNLESNLRKKGIRGIKVSGAGGGGHMFCFLPPDFVVSDDNLLNRLKRLEICVNPNGVREVHNGE